MHGLDLDLVNRLKFSKTRKEESIKGKGLLYSWEIWSRQPTNNGFVVIIQKWGQLQHDFRIVVVRVADEKTCVPIVEGCSETDSKLGANLIAHVVESVKISTEGDLWERLAGWWVEQQATKVIAQLKNEAAGYGGKGTLDKTTFAALAQKQNEIISQQELKSVVPVASQLSPVTKVEDLFQFKKKSGWLCKEGSKWKTWKKRWFRLTHHLLVYYNDMVEEGQAMDLKLIAGFFELQDCTLRETTRKEAGKTVFELCHSNRSLFMYAETEEERVEWMDAFRKNCQYKEGVYNRFQQSSQEAGIREANVTRELEETKKTLAELQAKTFLAEVHSDERMAEVKKKEKDIEELSSLRDKLKEMEEDYLQQKEIVGNLKMEGERLKSELQAAQTAHSTLIDRLEDQAKLKADLLAAQAAIAAAKESATKEEPKVTVHMEDKISANEKELEAALQTALAQVFELKEQKKVLVKEVKRLTKT